MSDANELDAVIKEPGTYIDFDYRVPERILTSDEINDPLLQCCSYPYLFIGGPLHGSMLDISDSHTTWLAPVGNNAGDFSQVEYKKTLIYLENVYIANGYYVVFTCIDLDEISEFDLVNMLRVNLIPPHSKT